MTKFATHSAETICAMVDRAIAEGRHTETIHRVCGGCNRLVTSIFFTTTDRKHLCPDCADGIGQGPLAMQREKDRQAQQRAAYAGGES